MSIQVYNSLTKTKEDLIPRDGKTIRMYSCGVTVYDKCHIGHARSLYTFEVIRNYLKHRYGDEGIKFVRNITDIDDKIINKANELNTNWQYVVTENIEAYHKDLERLDIKQADVEPRATDIENIDEMIKYIKAMLEKGFAYEVDGDVYFDVRKYNEFVKGKSDLDSYGALSGQSIDEMQEAVRIEKDEKKKDPLDFALWKRSREGDQFWDTPWGNGRPGWHIECSCMSRKHLECETLDIHAGGRDLIFPHHENEIAQAQAYDGKKFADKWIHHGLLTINGQKMAKSLGNFITIEEAIEKYGANALKLFFLSSHYRSPVDFSEGKMEEAKKKCENIKELLRKLHYLDISQEGSSSENLEEFYAAMDDDFNTPKALAVLSDMIRRCWKFMQGDKKDRITLRGKMFVIKNILDIFGLTFLQDAPLNIREEKLVRERELARQNKDFERADELREQLKSIGIIVQDTSSGTEFKRI